jgi:hypothetical protein
VTGLTRPARTSANRCIMWSTQASGRPDARYASSCPSVEALATSTFQLPVHPNLPQATVEWMAARLATIAREGTTP